MRSTKSIKQMKQLDFCGYEDLVEEILNELQYVKFEECGSISVIAKYDDAVGILNAVPNKAAEVVLKLINSAAANAENNKGMNKHDLYIAEITVTQGPTLKRSMAAGKGSANRILKRTSHINVVLDIKE
jgi:large subunit ribosomal protein L22